ncbi:MAG: hypothetical protein NAG76_10305 [Candidatus Pristimantibacillus lignocellulolyticus]|uniref:Uncharacterized protein n=1 Tax=Candidatus Pristimantibacillus lignocellulolyticus TaxID=2994561 RepID=A0A9J6ZKJ2_9BACL|nr:MAG: hypothetical protein NAG76_10305 [Candidatus Pristimantibacillus lignocellulolyticus]
MEFFPTSLFFTIFAILLYLGFFVLVIYCIVLFIKLARRGIKAFDLYIEEKREIVSKLVHNLLYLR